MTETISGSQSLIYLSLVLDRKGLPTPDLACHPETGRTAKRERDEGGALSQTVMTSKLPCLVSVGKIRV